MRSKETIVLCTTPFLPGEEATVIASCKLFHAGDISDVTIVDPWWGIVALTVTTFNAVTYAAYTAGAPPAAGTMMFDANRENFKAGDPLWWGSVTANIVQKGSKVLQS